MSSTRPGPGTDASPRYLVCPDSFKGTIAAPDVAAAIGAARVFAPQKGADEAAVARLSGRLQDFATELPRDPRGVPMTGCGGGLSGGLCAAFGANLRPGADYVLELLDFDARLRAADAAITGEGRIDSQSLEGKIVGRIATASAHAGRPLHVVVGRNDLDPGKPASGCS
jgi:glycerate kinase